MSETIDIWCNNCGAWSSATPTAVIGKSHWPPSGWVWIGLPNCRLHLCTDCWNMARRALELVAERGNPAVLRTIWEGRHEAFRFDLKAAG